MSKRKLKKIIKQLKGSSKMHKVQADTLEKMSRKEKLQEDLRKWVKERWVDIGAPKKGGGFKPCGRSKGEKRSGYPKCVPAAKAARMSKGQRRSAVARKRAAGNPGGKPTNVATFTKRSKKMTEETRQRLIQLLEKRCWKGYRRKKGATPYSKGSCVKVSEAKSPAWQRKAGKNPEGGLNKKGIASYRKANPGSKLSMAVTTKPSKLKAGSKKAKRRKSFCARMGGMKKRLTSAKTANDPDSRINKALRKWNC